MNKVDELRYELIDDLKVNAKLLNKAIDDELTAYDNDEMGEYMEADERMKRYVMKHGYICKLLRVIGIDLTTTKDDATGRITSITDEAGTEYFRIVDEYNQERA